MAEFHTSKNFSKEEKDLFNRLVSQYKHILENKSRNSENQSKKNNAWNIITAAYNSQVTPKVSL